LGNMKERGHFEDLSIDGKIIFAIDNREIG
jgi:hypothetical protein